MTSTGSIKDQIFLGPLTSTTFFCRKMREHNGDEWQEFNPKSNIFWLHYLLLKLECGEVKYANKRSKLHKKSMEDIKSFAGNILQYSSALEFVKDLH